MQVTTKNFVLSVFALAVLAACQPKEEAASKAPDVPASTAQTPAAATAKKAAYPVKSMARICEKKTSAAISK